MVIDVVFDAYEWYTEGDARKVSSADIARLIGQIGIGFNLKIEDLKEHMTSIQRWWTFSMIAESKERAEAISTILDSTTAYTTQIHWLHPQITEEDIQTLGEIFEENDKGDLVRMVLKRMTPSEIIAELAEMRKAEEEDNA